MEKSSKASSHSCRNAPEVAQDSTAEISSAQRGWWPRRKAGRRRRVQAIRARLPSRARPASFQSRDVIGTSGTGSSAGRSPHQPASLRYASLGSSLPDFPRRAVIWTDRLA